IHAEASDGEQSKLLLERPFFALETRRAAGVEFKDSRATDSLYDLGHITDKFRHHATSLELRGGSSAGLLNGWTDRFTYGYAWRRDRFTELSDGTTHELPGDRTLAYPWIGYERIENSFAKARNVDQISRTEDLFLGRSLLARLGYSARGL